MLSVSTLRSLAPFLEGYLRSVVAYLYMTPVVDVDLLVGEEEVRRLGEYLRDGLVWAVENTPSSYSLEGFCFRIAVDVVPYLAILESMGRVSEADITGEPTGGDGGMVERGITAFLSVVSYMLDLESVSPSHYYASYSLISQLKPTLVTVVVRGDSGNGSEEYPPVVYGAYLPYLTLPIRGESKDASPWYLREIENSKEALENTLKNLEDLMIWENINPKHKPYYSKFISMYERVIFKRVAGSWIIPYTVAKWKLCREVYKPFRKWLYIEMERSEEKRLKKKG